MLTRLSDPTSVDPNHTPALIIELNLVSSNRNTGATDRDLPAIRVRWITPTIFRLDTDPKILARSRVRRRNHHQPHCITSDYRQFRPRRDRNEMP